MNLLDFSNPRIIYLLLALLLFSPPLLISSRNLGIKQRRQLDHGDGDESPTYIWPLPSQYTSGNRTLTVDPNLSLVTSGNGSRSLIVSEAFDRYKRIIFKHTSSETVIDYDLNKLSVNVHTEDEQLGLGVDESYTLMVAANNGFSVIGDITIEANSVYGALRGLETLSQLCAFDYGTKTVKLYNAPWYIQDKPRFMYRGLLLDTSRHYLPIEVIKQVIESMSYAKLNVLHWHIIDEESFPLEVPTYPNLWKGAYTKWERYTIDDASEIVQGTGYPDLWPSTSCREPLDVSKNFTFDLISGILSDLRKVFPFELFHLGGDEVHTDCWNSTPHVKQWFWLWNVARVLSEMFAGLQDVLMSSLEETFNTFATSLNPKTVVHNWLESGVCAKAVAKGFRCIFSNQGFWYLDHLDVPWDSVYYADPLEGISDASEQKQVLGGEVCMWGETADASNVQQTIWPRAAAAAERLWSDDESLSSRNSTVLPRLEYFRCLLTRRGVPAAPVRNFYARSSPTGPGSCYSQ
ncbi:beta-hexosaminidase 1 [Phtheirospermum japonicum]|uniref:Beta-hexosaminidase n=1 Tax=Phtheirospermum japonicum TaxID=374723 RepID=A0A830AWF7_9LAMI|nr:beta-hexosaminidase 1 [Phtheirospermum japonicum]